MPEEPSRWHVWRWGSSAPLGPQEILFNSFIALINRARGTGKPFQAAGHPEGGQGITPDQQNPPETQTPAKNPPKPDSSDRRGWPHACRGRFWGGSCRAGGSPAAAAGPAWPAASRGLYWFTEVLIRSQSSCLTTEPRLYSCLHLITALERHFPSHPPSPPDSSPNSHSSPFQQVKAPSQDNSGRLEFPRAGKRELGKAPRGSGTQKILSTPPAEPGLAAPRGSPCPCQRHLRASLNSINSIKGRHPRKRPEMRPGGPGAALTKSF